MTSAYPRVEQNWALCWDRLFGAGSSNKNSSVCQDVFQRYVAQRYAEPQRYYHTIKHLESMFVALDEYLLCCTGNRRGSRVAHPLDDPDALLIVLLATFFHDAVYDPRSPTNEEDSVAWFMQFWREAEQISTTLGAAPADVLWSSREAADRIAHEVERYIAATKTHLSIPPREALTVDKAEGSGNEARHLAGLSDCFSRSPADDVLHVFLDMDLKVLGEEPMQYAQYAEQVREEYEPFVGPEVFNKNRGLFLDSFLGRPMWFKTPYFFYMYEKRARANVQRERDALAPSITQ